jgi:predicted branched-subunit amino acid permease
LGAKLLKIWLLAHYYHHFVWWFKSKSVFLHPETVMRRKEIMQGFRDGIPIALGYFAVAFSLGIIAKQAGLSAVIGFVSSFFTRASAG